MEIHQYQVVVVNLDPTIGSKIKKTGPCVIISPDEMNHNLSTVVIAPLTSTKRNYPTRAKISLKDKESRVALDQIRTVDKQHIVSILSMLKVKEIVEIKSIINRTYVE